MDFTPIDVCHKSVEGQNLVQVHGMETLSLQPTLTFVPWVVYDKVKTYTFYFKISSLKFRNFVTTTGFRRF